MKEATMYAPEIDDEITGLAKYLEQQLDAIRASAIGLTDEQMRMRPCRSALSIGGIVKHATYVMRGATTRLTGDLSAPPALDGSAIEAHEASFTLTADETGDGVMAAFDGARAAYLGAFIATDPNVRTVVPPAPWFGIYDNRPANGRYSLVHQIEEMARHAGHADIIREQIDGVAVPSIMLTEAGMAANEFFEPYVPAPGTVGSSK
jgi:hypothetical protein